MKTAEQIAEKLWEKYRSQLFSKVDVIESDTYMTKDDFLAALKEYGGLVRQRAAGVADQFLDPEYVHNIVDAIERMELP